MSADRDGKAGPTRRGLLKAGLAAGAVVGTGAWSSAPGGGVRFPRLRQPGSLPYPQLPMGTDTIPQIEHIVVLMMENHSYDNKLGMLRRRGADGFRLGRDGLPLATNPYANGDIQHAFRMPTTCQNNAPSQEWQSSHIQFDNGRNDGFVESPAAGRCRWATGSRPTSRSTTRWPRCSRSPTGTSARCSARPTPTGAT